MSYYAESDYEMPLITPRKFLIMPKNLWQPQICGFKMCIFREGFRIRITKNVLESIVQEQNIQSQGNWDTDFILHIGAT